MKLVTAVLSALALALLTAVQPAAGAPIGTASIATPMGSVPASAAASSTPMVGPVQASKTTKITQAKKSTKSTKAKKRTSKKPRKLKASAAPLSGRVKVGAWVAGMVADPSLLIAREQLLGRQLDIASYFYGYGDWFPTDKERVLSGNGARAVLISWDMGPYRFADWAAGNHDDYLRTIGSLAAAYPYPVYVRPWAEMNGDWAPYQPTAAGDRAYGGTPAEFVAAWRHVVSTVRSAGGANIKWVFNPYAATYAQTTSVPSIWPGKAYVDVLGMDGYNWGGGPSPWQSFSTIFTGMYNILAKLDSTLPIWICEVGSREPTVDDGAPVLKGKSKGTWVTDMFAQTGFGRVKAIVWFDERKERDWRFDSSAASLTAFRRALAR